MTKRNQRDERRPAGPTLSTSTPTRTRMWRPVNYLSAALLLLCATHSHAAPDPAPAPVRTMTCTVAEKPRSTCESAVSKGRPVTTVATLTVEAHNDCGHHHPHHLGARTAAAPCKSAGLVYVSLYDMSFTEAPKLLWTKLIRVNAHTAPVILTGAFQVTKLQLRASMRTASNPASMTTVKLKLASTG